MPFKWLEQYKQSVAQQPPQSRQVGFATVPRSQRYPIQQTGAGPDGMVQQGMPVGMMPGGDLVHEGEGVINGPGGPFVMDAPGMAAMTPGAGMMPMQMPPQMPMPQQQMGGPVMPQPSPEQQQQLMGMQRMGAAGRALGGFSLPSNPLGIGFPTPSTNLTNPTIPSTRTSFTAGASNPIKTAASDFRNGGNPLGINLPDLNSRTLVKGGGTGAGGGTNLSTELGSAIDRRTNVPVADPPADYIPTDEVTTGDNVVTDNTRASPSQSTLFRNTAMGRLQGVMRGGDPAVLAASQQGIDDLNAQNATERMVARQQAAQGNLDDSVAAARGADLARTQAGAVADATAQGGIEQMKAQQQAATTLAQQGLAGQQFDWTKDNEMVSSLIAAKDYDGANAYLTSIGMPTIDFGEIQRLDAIGETYDAADRVFSLLQNLPENADPRMVSLLTSTYVGLMSEGLTSQTGGSPWASQPVATGQYAGYSYQSYDGDAQTYTFTGPNGATQTFSRDQLTADPALMSAAFPLMATFEDEGGDPDADPTLNALADEVGQPILEWLRDDSLATGGAALWAEMQREPYIANLIATGTAGGAGANAAWEELGVILTFRNRMQTSGDDVKTALTGVNPQTAEMLLRSGVISNGDYTTYMSDRQYTPTTWLGVMATTGRATTLSADQQAELVAAYRAGDATAAQYIQPTTAANSSGGVNIFSDNTNEWTSANGNGRHAWAPGVHSWVVANIGKLYADGGRVYRIDALNNANPEDYGSVAYITVTDVQTGTKYYIYKGFVKNTPPKDNR